MERKATSACLSLAKEISSWRYTLRFGAKPRLLRKDKCSVGIGFWLTPDTGVHEPPRTNALIFENQMIKGPVWIVSSLYFPLDYWNRCKKSSTIL